ncbi:MAG TPA: hypothetical protein VE890_05445 [Thermoguttaceae bacterium]|nr:hypothetical protein [Thermoguttaceae bacterium]
MNAFRVWIRPLGGNCRLRVDGIGNTQWLLDCLGRSFVFKTAAPVNEEYDSPYCSFHVAYNSQTSHRSLQRLLAGIPEVSVIADPA